MSTEKPPAAPAKGVQRADLRPALALEELLDLLLKRQVLDREQAQEVTSRATTLRSRVLKEQVGSVRSQAAARYDVTPDLTALGKVIGGGFPAGAIVGRAEVMDVMNPLADRLLFPHSGTFSANPITDRVGKDFNVYEEDSGAVEFVDMRVEVSENGSTWINVNGTAGRLGIRLRRRLQIGDVAPVRADSRMVVVQR